MRFQLKPRSARTVLACSELSRGAAAPCSFSKYLPTPDGPARQYDFAGGSVRSRPPTPSRTITKYRSRRVRLHPRGRTERQAENRCSPRSSDNRRISRRPSAPSCPSRQKRGDQPGFVRRMSLLQNDQWQILSDRRAKSHRLENRNFSLSLEMTAQIISALRDARGTFWVICLSCKKLGYLSISALETVVPHAV